MHLGFNAEILIGKADVVVVIDSEVPWIPKEGHLNPKAKVIHISADPLESDFPYREYETDLLVAGSSAAAMASLRKALRKATKGANGAIDKRRAKVAELRAEIDARRKKILQNAGNETPVHPHYLASCINQMKKKDAIIVNELGIPVSQIDFEHHGSYISTSLAGGLGSGLGFALGAKLAAPEREVICVVGDGSYMFGNPVPAHFVGRAESLPTLTVVANNMQWYAVRTSTLDLYADGAAAKANSMPLTELRPSPDFEKVIHSCGGHGEKVEAPGDLMPAMKRALAAVRSGTPALLNVICQARR
jgi:acetolactate synthase-1/2/3 large subunit